MRRSRLRSPAGVAGAVAAALLLAGCGSSAATPAGDGAPPAASATAARVESPPAPSPTTPTEPPYDGPVLAIGDSVMLGADPCLAARGITVDADESRSYWGVYDVLDAALAAGTLPDRVVLHTGTNGEFGSEVFANLMERVGDREAYWVTIHLPDEERYAFAEGLNAFLADEVGRYPNAHLIDWDAAVAENTGKPWLYDDQIHLTPAGCKAFARLVDTAVRAPIDAAARAPVDDGAVSPAP